MTMKKKKCHTFPGWIESEIGWLSECGRKGTARTYSAALRSLRKYLGDEDVALQSVNAALIGGYNAWLSGRNVARNTISFYNRVLRAAYNAAVARGVVADQHPFGQVFTGAVETRKRAMTLSLMRRLVAPNLSDSPELDFARDLFLLSFILRGMSFVDMAYLRKADLRDGYLTYYRRKTGHPLRIRWVREIDRILEKYPSDSRSGYLLPILRGEDDVEREYRNVYARVNHNLKRLGKMLGMEAPLTLYVARHTWASLAQEENFPVSVISAGLGHESERTTRIYLAAFHTPQADKVTSHLLSLLL